MKDKSIIHIFSLFCLGCVIIIIGVTGCGNEASDTVVVTAVVVEGEEQIVTRIIRQTAVPSSNESVSSPKKPITLDINFALSTAPDIDPQTVESGEGIDLVENLFVGLTRYNHKLNQIEPEFATDWHITRNGRVWTFNLRDDIFWVKPTNQDDLSLIEVTTPVVAKDIVYAIQRVCSRATNTPDAVVLFIIEGCEQVHTLANPKPADLNRIGAVAINDNTVQITLTKPASYFLTITSLWLMKPVPSFLIDEVGDSWTMADNLVVSGPFIGNANFTRLKSNPFWPIDTHIGNVDIVNITYLNDVNDAIQLWNAKRLDTLNVPDSFNGELSERAIEKGSFITGQTVFYYAFNFDSPVFREPALRRAFSAAIDREKLVEEIYGGQAMMMRHLLPPGVLGAPEINEVGMGYDPDYARIQIHESGFRSCRLMPPMQLLVTTSDQSLRQAELIRQMWIDELGCTEEQIIINQAQFGTLLANTRQDAGSIRPDIWELGWASYYPDAQNWFGDLLHCVDSENRQNRGCSEVDDLIRQAANGASTTDRVDLYRQIENQLFSRGGIVPMAPLYVPAEFVLIHNWIKYTPALFGGEQFDTYIIDAELKELERSR